MQEAIKLDFMYDTLTFGKEKGFAWSKVAYIVNFTNRLVSQIKECEKITDILGFFNMQASDLLQTLGEREYKIFSTYVFETLLPHFKLYRLVFTTPRKEQIPKCPIHIEPPFDVQTLKESKPLKVWEYERKVEELERKEAERVNELLKEKSERLSKMDKEREAVVKSVVSEDKPLSKDSIGSIIEEVMKKYTMAATENIKFDISRLRDELEFKLEKTSLPRPAALGPPPRYAVQPVKVPSSKSPKSPKPGSRMSMKSKKK